MEWNIYPNEFVSTYMNNQDEMVILDVREQDEYEKYHLPGSILLPPDDLYYKMKEIPSNKAIYVICEHGVRSIQAVMILYDAGYHDVYNVMGGFEKILLLYPDLPIDNSFTS